MRNQRIVNSIVDITRPADTTTYAAADVIAAVTSGATASKFTKAAGKETGSQGGVIVSASISSSQAAGTALDADLFLFTTAPTDFGSDNAAFTPTDAEMLKCIGAINLDGTAAANDFIGSGNRIVVVQNLNLAYECEANDSLHGVLVARNAYVPISEEVFRIRLGIQQG